MNGIKLIIENKQLLSTLQDDKKKALTYYFEGYNHFNGETRRQKVFKFYISLFVNDNNNNEAGITNTVKDYKFFISK